MLRAILLLTKGILRDTRLRRNLMLWLMLAAMGMLFLGWVLIPTEWAHRHYVMYFAYWAVCLWLTIAGMLLAVFDMLIIRAAGQAMRRRIEQDIAHIETKTKGEQK